MLKELKSRHYDIVIHSAAVSDYRPKVICKKKVKSGRKYWKINLVPTAKIIDLIKRVDKSIFLVGFKFEPHSSRNRLINQAKILMKNSQADLVVANTIYDGRYNAYILSPIKIKDAIKSREKLAEALLKEFKTLK
jgi:phosphopantothenoylcysteine decarboxylase/phosphopantothenate--cysteine ligase